MNKLCKRMKYLWVLFIIVGAVACGPSRSPTVLPLETASAHTPELTTPQITPEPTQEDYAPTIINLEDRSISDGERFRKLVLDEYVIDEDHTADEIDWRISGNDELDVLIIRGNAYVTLPRVDWTGSETLAFEVCDPDGFCDTKEISFTVRAENDTPQVSIFGQIILTGETFGDIDLDDVVYDEDNVDDELIWNVSSDGDLSIVIEEGVVTVELPEAEWLGQETIRFEACDPEGACNTADATFWVMERTDAQVEVTYIGNAGFMITVGDKKILIDALFEGAPIPSDVAELLELAQPPFDDVDLILASHIHYDHFNAEMVFSHLENNLGSMFVSSHDVVSAVTEIEDVWDRAIAIQLQRRVGEKTQLVVNEIGLEVLFLDHGGGIPNLGFIVTTEGRRFFHTGDMDTNSVSVSQLQRYGLPDKRIDIAFVAHFMLITEEQHAHILEGIQAEHIVAMHYQFTYPVPDYDLMEYYFPDAIVFRESMESWLLNDTSSP
jgi:L-ascorbate metabolism protein UlaG (beta-lactamase superfamily)